MNQNLACTLDAQLANCADYWGALGVQGSGGPTTPWFRSGLGSPLLNGVRHSTATDLSHAWDEVTTGLSGVAGVGGSARTAPSRLATCSSHRAVSRSAHSPTWRSIPEPSPLRHAAAWRFVKSPPRQTSRPGPGCGGWLYAVSTRADVRRGGIGRSMTLAALDAARGRELLAVGLQSSPQGLPLYLSIGFEQISGYALFSPSVEP